MIFSMKELQKYGNLKNDLKVEDLVHAINSIGFEVEEYFQFNHVEKIKYGKVLEVSKNPNGELLNVCKIQFDDKIRTIQTVAKNVEVGKFVIAFVPGSILDGKEMQAKELKGIISEGMLCGINEFGFDKNLFDPKEIEGIINLDYADLKADPVEDLVLNDYLIDISILSNRSDANSYYVMSKEIAAYFDIFKTNDETSVFDKQVFNSQITLDEGLIGFITNKNNFFLNLNQKIFLLKSNIKVNNSIEDFINFFTLQFAVPFQILDASTVTNLTIKQNQSTINFNNESYNSNQIYLLKNNNDVIGIPNIYIDGKYQITKDSKEILFLFSFINTKIMRQMNKIFKLDNLSVKQSCKNLSKGLTTLAQNIFVKNGFITSCINETKINNENLFIKFDINFIDEIAGFKISEQKLFDEVIKKLTFLGFTFDLKNEKVYAPQYRNDINNIYDIIEELFRFYGYSNFSPKSLNATTLFIEPLKNIKHFLVSKGYNETKGYTLVNKNKNKFNPFSFDTSINLLTFTSIERSTIRNSQLESILEIIEYNQKRKIQDINIFDIGIINNCVNSLILATNTKNFTHLKKDIFELFNKEFALNRITNNPQFNSNNSAYLMQNNKIVGWIGSPNLHNYETDCLFAEILTNEITFDVPKIEAYNSEPLKIRDLTFTIKNNDLDLSISKYLNYFKDLPNVYSVKIKDKFIKEDSTNVTIRFSIDANSIDKFEEIIKLNNLG